MLTSLSDTSDGGPIFPLPYRLPVGISRLQKTFALMVCVHVSQSQSRAVNALRNRFQHSLELAKTLDVGV